MAKWTKKINSPMYPKVTTRQFAISVTFLTLGIIGITFWGTRNPDDYLGPIFIMAIQSILFVNAIVPHIVMTVKAKMYSPGVITAVLINIPFTIYLFIRAINEHRIAPSIIAILFLAAPFAMAAFDWFSFWLGEKIDGLFWDNDTVGH